MREVEGSLKNLSVDAVRCRVNFDTALLAEVIRLHPTSPSLASKSSVPHSGYETDIPASRFRLSISFYASIPLLWTRVGLPLAAWPCALNSGPLPEGSRIPAHGWLEMINGACYEVWGTRDEYCLWMNLLNLLRWVLSWYLSGTLITGRNSNFE